MTGSRFHEIALRHLHRIPPPFQESLREVVIQIEDRASPDLLADLGYDPKASDELLGLYEGVPLTERQDAFEAAGPMPGSTRIRLFREPILHRAGTDPTAIEEEIRITLLHEIGHHFGLDEDRLDQLGYA